MLRHLPSWQVQIGHLAVWQGRSRKSESGYTLHLRFFFVRNLGVSIYVLVGTSSRIHCMIKVLLFCFILLYFVHLYMTLNLVSYLYSSIS